MLSIILAGFTHTHKYTEREREIWVLGEGFGT